MTITAELQNETPSKLSVRRVSKRFRTEAGETQALDDVSLEVSEG